MHWLQAEAILLERMPTRPLASAQKELQEMEHVRNDRVEAVGVSVLVQAAGIKKSKCPALKDSPLLSTDILGSTFTTLVPLAKQRCRL